MDRLTWTVGEVAILLGISRGAAYGAVRRGELPAIRVGGRLVVSRTALERMLEQPRDRPWPTVDVREQK